MEKMNMEQFERLVNEVNCIFNTGGFNPENKSDKELRKIIKTLETYLIERNL